MLPEPQRVRLDGLDLAYRTVGEEGAPTVVLLHGWASSLRMWDTTQASLAPRFRTIALDLPGHGASSKPEWTWYSIPRYAEVVARFADHFALDGIAAIGHSMGGTIALELASGGGIDLRRVIVVNPVVTGRVYSHNILIKDTWVDSAVRVSRRLWPAASRLLRRPPNGLRRAMPDYVVRNREDLAMTTADSALGSMRAVLTWDLRERLPAVRTRTLVIVGEADRVVAPSEGEVAARSIPRARLVRLPAGHHPYDEVPQAFFAAIESFLREETAS